MSFSQIVITLLYTLAYGFWHGKVETGGGLAKYVLSNEILLDSHSYFSCLHLVRSSQTVRLTQLLQLPSTPL